MIGPFSALRRPRIALAAAAAIGALALPAGQPAAGAAAAESADRIAYVLLVAGARDSMMSGSMDDLRRAQALRSGREGLLYVRQGGAGYVIRDAATLREAQAIFAPQQLMGERQAALGARQAALGERQARLGARQANATPRQQAELGRQQAELGRQQNALGQQQSELGREQSRLGRIAEARVRTLIAEAIRSGTAERVD